MTESQTHEIATGVAAGMLPIALEQSLPTACGFARFLLLALEEEQVRYGVLSGMEELAGEPDPSGELDVAIHPADLRKLRSVFRIVSARGYRPIQTLRDATGVHGFVFLWLEGVVVKTAIVRFVGDPRDFRTVWKSGEALLAGRQRYADIWVVEPATEFTYLLMKHLPKGSVPPRIRRRLQVLIARLDTGEAEKIATDLFGKKWGREIVRACSNPGSAEPAFGPVSVLISQAHGRGGSRRTWPRLRERNLVASSRPSTGLSLFLLGPDGVGKSTLAVGLTEVLRPAFSRHRNFHWRPGVILPIRDGDDSLSSPHAEPVRGAVLSVLYLLGFFLDFWAGELLRVRPLHKQSGLAMFDRYFWDLLIDPRRYRYGGPMGLVRLLARLVPGRDGLVLVLDAPEEVILSRKRQLSEQELRRQSGEYRQLNRVLPHVYVLNTERGIQQTLADASRIISAHLSRRFDSGGDSSSGAKAHYNQVTSS